MFEDTSLEFVREELLQAPADVVKTLGGIGSESENATTSVALEWPGSGARLWKRGEGAWKKQACGGVPLRGCRNSQRTLTVRLVLRVDCA